MSATTAAFAVIFPDWYDDRAEFEHQSKGFLPGVVVRLADGRSYPLYFMDPVRLRQEAEDEFQMGRPFFAEPGLVVVPEVTPEAIRSAAAGLVASGYLEHLRPSAHS